MTTKSKDTRRKPHSKTLNFPIVGIGASAGGLEAIIELLMHLPPKTGMAFIVIQHLDPTHKSMIGEILSKKTLMKVAEIKKSIRVQPDHVYVIPPNANLSILHGVIKVLPRVKNKAIPLPINSFFKSLANDQKNKCIGIILSGTGSDGTDGLEAIKTQGGLTIVQEPKSAKYDGMPSSAISREVADKVLTPINIAEELVRISRHPRILDEKLKLTLSTDLEKNDNERYLSKILTLLQNKCHVDFSHYKYNTLDRRISRRMALIKKNHLKEYFEYLEAHADEVNSLYADILINVTEFFRDPQAFKEFKARILPDLLKKRDPKSPIRMWVVGCATGEEAYSVVMSLLEYLEHAGIRKPPIQLFATDISEPAIQKARAGYYDETISKNVSKERLQKFFTKTETGYKIKNFIRELCLFSWHNVLNAPPYAKLDLICCRNVLIYFNQELQEHVLPIFHYALKPEATLWLGSSESIGKNRPLFFKLIDKTQKFYSRQSISSLQKSYFPASAYLPEKMEIAKKLTGHRATDIGHEIDHVIASKYAPPGLVVNPTMEIIHTRGDISPYLQWSTGQPSFNLFKMARLELISDLRIGLRTAKKTNVRVRKTGCTLKVGDQLKIFDIDIIPFTFTLASQIKECHFLISFELVENAPLALKTKKSNKQRDSQHLYIKVLEQEQSDAKIHQKSLIQDFEITQEELISSNEELQTTLEEFQSTNEELETAKEELQSLNEELTTLNDELQSRNIDLAKLNDDLINLLACTNIPIVMVDINTSIRRFTPTAAKLLNLIQSDVGRPINNINPNFDQLDLGALTSEVIETMVIKELNIQDRKNNWFRVQIRPYKTADNKIDGAVIALMDINLLKQNLIDSEASLDYATSIANTVQLPLVVLDKNLRLKSANHAFYDKFHVRAENKGVDLLSLLKMTGKTIHTDLRQALTVAFSSDVGLKDVEVDYEFSNAEHGTMLLNGRCIKWISEEEPNALLLSIQDITHRLKMEKSLKEAIAESIKANLSKDIFLATLSHELRTPLTAILCWTQLLLKTDKASDKFKRGLEAIEQNSKIQGQLIDDLLDISRIQSGKVVLSVMQLDPIDIVHKAVESVRPLAAKKSVVIKTHIKSLNGDVNSDPTRLQQIVWNLLINAIKFSPTKKTITIRIKPVKKNKQSFASIQIIDQGKGIKPDFLPHLFERFTQADNTVTRLHGGLGLGLTIVHDLLKLLGGNIHAESAGVGKGATFTIFLPLIPNAKKQKMQAKFAEVATKTTLWQNLSGLSILIVEDEQDTLDVLTELLNFAGAKTISVTSAAAAENALDQYKPDILISDIAMPIHDGISLIQSIRDNGTSHGKKIPAIALTAYTTQEDIDRALLAGFNAHVAKPFNAADLIICIATLAQKSRK